MMLVLGGCAFESSSSINTHHTVRWYYEQRQCLTLSDNLFSMCCIPAKTDCEHWDPYDILCFAIGDVTV